MMCGKKKLFLKQTITVTLLLLFVYNVLFAHISLWLWKVYMNEQLEEWATTLPNEDLELIVLPLSQTVEREIDHNGEMYDVIRYEVTETVIHYFCMKDFTENILASTLNEKTLLAKKQWSGHAKKLQHQASLKYLSPQQPDLQSPIPKVHLYSVTEGSTLATYLAINTPPPDLRLI
jgi:hypothetical protein